MRIIDFHAHLDDRWLHVPIPDASLMIEAMDRFGVAQACVFTMMGFYGDTRRHNDLLLERCRRHPGRLIPFVTVDPKEGAAAVDELERCLESPEFRGIKFHPWLQAFASSMVEETMTAILKIAARTGTPVLLHDGTPPYSTTFQVAELARWVPEAKVFLGHAGLSDYADAAARLIRDVPNLYGCHCGSRPGELAHLVETAGADKITFGSDFVPGSWELLAERLDNTIEAGLSPEDLEAVLWRNAERILRPSGS